MKLCLSILSPRWEINGHVHASAALLLEKEVALDSKSRIQCVSRGRTKILPFILSHFLYWLS